MDRNGPNEDISQLLPEPDLLDEFARMAAWSFACEKSMSQVFAERKAADIEAQDLFLGMAAYSYSDIDDLLEDGGKTIRETLRRFENEFWASGREFLESHPAIGKELTIRQIRRTHGVGTEEYARTFDIYFNGSCLSFNHLIENPSPPGGGMWEVQVEDDMLKCGHHLGVIINLRLRFVGPWVRYWLAYGSGLGVDVLLAVLKASFGDSIGLRVSAWRASRGLTVSRAGGDADERFGRSRT